MSKTLSLLVCFQAFCILSIHAQMDKHSDLSIELQKQDSMLFERGFNRCDLDYLQEHIAEDLKFYHDQGGFQDKQRFLENTEKFICANVVTKPIRKLDPKSLEVYPLYKNGKLYGAIQKGIHHFYLREKGKADLQTSSASFTHVWLLDEDNWKISTVLSYDHK